MERRPRAGKITFLRVLRSARGQGAGRGVSGSPRI